MALRDCDEGMDSQGQSLNTALTSSHHTEEYRRREGNENDFLWKSSILDISRGKMIFSGNQVIQGSGARMEYCPPLGLQFGSKLQFSPNKEARDTEGLGNGSQNLSPPDLPSKVFLVCINLL